MVAAGGRNLAIHQSGKPNAFVAGDAPAPNPRNTGGVGHVSE